MLAGNGSPETVLIDSFLALCYIFPFISVVEGNQQCQDKPEDAWTVLLSAVISKIP